RDRLRRAGLDWVGNAEEAGQRAVDRDEENRLPFSAQRVGAFAERTGVDALLLEQLVVAERDGAPRDLAAHAAAGQRLERIGTLDPDTARFGAAHHGGGDRMLAA